MYRNAVSGLWLPREKQREQSIKILQKGDNEMFSHRTSFNILLIMNVIVLTVRLLSGIRILPGNEAIRRG